MAQRDRGMRAQLLGQAEEAVRAFGVAARLCPELAEAHLQLGRALTSAGRIEAARRAYERALACDPGLRPARSGLAALPRPPGYREDFKEGQLLRSNASGKAYWVLERRQGLNGMVYVVHDEREVLLALKTFQSRYLWRDEDRQRFEQEAWLWVRLERHPNVVTALLVDQLEGLPCLVLEYLPGGSLRTALKQGPLPVERALALALQVCDGMTHAHETLGIVHRDLKPANCLLTGDGELKVSDFGFAASLGQTSEAFVQLASLDPGLAIEYSTPPGTEEYMAPEQRQPGGALDVRSDIYAFGILLYEVLTGTVPSAPGCTTPKEAIQANRATLGLSSLLLGLLLDCVEPAIANRPESFQQVRAELETAHRHLTGRVAPAVARPSGMDAAAWQDKSLALWTLGRYQEALECCERGLENAPYVIGLWNNKGLALLGLERPEEALTCFERGLAIGPPELGLWNSKGGALLQLGRNHDALAWLDQGLERAMQRGMEQDPRIANLWGNKGLALDRLGRWDAALVCYEQAVKLDAEAAHLWLNTGLTLARLRRFGAALQCLERGLEVAPRHGDLWRYKGVTLLSLGRYHEALDCFDRTLELVPPDSELHKLKGVALDRLGQWQKALACYDRGLDLDPDDARLWEEKGTTLTRLHRLSEADISFRRARELRSL
jgi:tetratricopeptide (TPR) repeat protein